MSEIRFRSLYFYHFRAIRRTAGTTLSVIAAFVFTWTAAMSVYADTITYTYDVTEQIGGSGAYIVNDTAWTGNNLDAWFLGSIPSGDGALYLRNGDEPDSVSGDELIIRPNDTNFAFSVPGNTTLLTFEFQARVPYLGSNFMEVGLSSGSNTLFRVGSDFGDNNGYHVWTYDGTGGELRTTGGAHVADSLHNFRLEIDTTTNGGDGSAVLYVNEGSTVTVGNMHLLDGAAPAITALDSLWVYSASRYVGPGDMSITVNAVPEPSTWMLMVLGLAGLITLRRWHR